MYKGFKRKKGKNISKAKKYIFKGVEYASGLEVYMAQQLTFHKIPFEYNKKSFVLQDSFKFENDSFERQANGKGEFKNRNTRKILPIKYTPDFTGDDFIIETKGYANESFPLRWKMFKHYLHKSNNNTPVYKPQTRKECDTVIKLIQNGRNKR